MDKIEHFVADRRTRPISTATRRTRKSKAQKCDFKKVNREEECQVKIANKPAALRNLVLT